MTPVEFHEAAVREQDEAADWYNGRAPGLGLDFLAEVERAVERIRQLPETWPIISPRSRRCLLNRFPYGLVYQVQPDRIVILAVMHLRRRPGYWLGRE